MGQAVIHLEPISKQSKCPWRCCETVQNAHILRVCSAFSTFRAPGGGISQSSTCALNTNLIFEIGSSILRIKLKLNFVENIEPEPREIGQKEAFCKGLVEKLREMRSLMRVNLLNLLMADGEGIFI